MLFESAISANPAEAITEVMKRAANAKVVVIASESGEDDTVEFLRRGVRGIVSRAIGPELLVRCVRKIQEGETWLDNQGVNWVIEAYRKQALAAGYTGDSILNSLMDNVSMATGFLLARLLSWKATVALVLVLEIGAAALVHDNLTLNVLNFVHRFPAIEAWQMKAQK